MMNIPQNLKEAIAVFFCERTYLVLFIKGLLDKYLPKEAPKFFDDPYLEMQFKKQPKKRDLSEQNVYC